MKLTPELMKEMGFKEIKGFYQKVWYLPSTEIEHQNQFQVDLNYTKSLKKLIENLSHHCIEYGQQFVIKDIKRVLQINEN